MEEIEAGTRLLDRHADRGLFVRRQIVEHDDIAGAQRGHEDLIDVRAERRVIDRSVEHGRCPELGGAECRHDGVRLPVAARRVIRGAGASRAARISPQQVSGHARFVDEHILRRILRGHPGGPLPAGGNHIRSTLFGGVHGFFETESQPIDFQPQRAQRRGRRQFVTQFCQRRIGPCGDQRRKPLHSTLLNDLRVPVKIAQEQLGHASIATTLNIYTHVVDASHRRAVEAVEDRLFDLDSNGLEFAPGRETETSVERSVHEA